MRSPSSFVLFLASLAQAQQYLVNELSFGHQARIAPENTYSIPNFSIQGRPNIPELLSNKVILTPVAPGNQRGAVWADHTLQQNNWIADVEFRANGPERGSGNFNIWLARDGSHVVGPASLYTVGRFEGLVLVIDQYHGSGGMLRGFLNDGTTDYQSQHNVDNLAFGHCYFTYRNLGRPTQIKLRHTESKFTVEVAGRTCFESDKIRIPAGYNFGITAASGDNPDSFEVFKFTVLTEDNAHHASSHDQQQQQQQHLQDSSHHDQQQQQTHQQDEQNNNGRPPTKMRFGRGGQTVIEDAYDNVIPDQEAKMFTSSAAQFEDLHNRLMSMNHHITTIFRSLGQAAGVGEQRHQEMSTMVGELKGLLHRLDKLDVLEHRMGDIERELRSLRNEISGRLKESENSIKYHVSEHHDTLHEAVSAHAGKGHGRLIFVILASQCVVAGVYVWYKRKRVSVKKYL